MYMIVHHHPGITGSGGLVKKDSQTVEEFVSILIVPEDG
jgi:hypothetical protein